MNEWQPIETAPKDGTNVIVGWPKDHYHAGVEIGSYDSQAKGWISNECSCLFSATPTHWMSVPDLPFET